MASSVGPQIRVTRNNNLTERELEVMRARLRSGSTRAAAELLGISENTIDNHTRHIHEKLNVDSFTNAVLKIWPLIGSDWVIEHTDGSFSNPTWRCHDHVH